jgi:anti-anti-sigma factor
MPGQARLSDALSVTIEVLDGDRAVVRLRGDLDLATAPLLAYAVRMLSAGDRCEVCVDAADLSFCDCAGVEVILRAVRRSREAGGRLTVVRPSRPLRRVLEILDLRDEELLGGARPSWPALDDRPGPAPKLVTDLADVAGRLAIQEMLDDAIGQLTRLCGRVVEAVDDASVTVRRSGRYATLAATGELAQRLDSVQYRADDGPCVEALSGRVPVSTTEMGTETRWLCFTQRARDAGIRGVLSVPLELGGDTVLGSLNLYSRRGAFTETDVATATAMSICAIAALTAVREREKIANLEKALQSNRDIGMALGIIMARRAMTPANAFDLLRTVRQRSQRKLAEVAADVVYTGKLYSPEMQRGV